MKERHTALFVPGLRDNTSKVEKLTRHWKDHGLVPFVYRFGWSEVNEDFEPKYDRYLGTVDELLQEGNVSVIGNSGGGSVAVLTLIDRPDIAAAINVCGMLKLEHPDGWRKIMYIWRDFNPVFVQAVNKLESRVSELQATDRRKILTIRAKYGDELVPAHTTIIEGATNIAIPRGEHVLTITESLTTFSDKLIDFIKSQS